MVAALKDRASRQNRSLEAESRVILERAARKRVVDVEQARARAEKISRFLENRPHSDSAGMIREDRNR